MTRTSVLPRHAIVALQFLTRLPTPPLDRHAPDDLARAATWFPVVGVIVGAIVAAAAWAGTVAHPQLGALLGLCAWVWITGGLHLDGLGDAADGLAAAHRGPERFLAVAKDPHAGVSAVVAVALLLIAKFALLSATPVSTLTAAAALALIPAWARWTATVVSAAVPPLGDGSGRAFAQGRRTIPLVAAGVALTLASAGLAPAVAVALPLTAGSVLYWRWRLGGVNGDCIGATIEVVEAVLLAALVVWHSLVPVMPI